MAHRRLRKVAATLLRPGEVPVAGEEEQQVGARPMLLPRLEDRLPAGRDVAAVTVQEEDTLNNINKSHLGIAQFTALFEGHQVNLGGSEVAVGPDHGIARRLQGMRAAADRIRGGDVLTVMPRHPGESEVSMMCDAVGNLVEQLRSEVPKPPEPAPPAPTPPSGYVKPGPTDPRRVVW